MTEASKSFAEKVAKRPAVLLADGARSSSFRISPALDMPLFHPDIGDGATELSDSADHRISVHDSIQRSWQKLQKLLDKKRIDIGNPLLTDIAVDSSSPSKLILQGRYVPPELGKPIYWAVRDNRVVFSHPFQYLSETDKVNLSNQVLNAFAKRSEKTDVKCAAMAISERGEALIAVNTPEGENMQINKECAESNLSTLTKQLMGSKDKIRRLYVLGGSVDATKNTIDPHSSLISMCNTCVEKTSPVMHEDAIVTALPAVGERTRIGLSFAEYPSEVGVNEAWQTPYMNLKGPSIIHFSHDAELNAQRTYQRMLNKSDLNSEISLTKLHEKAQVKSLNKPSRERGILFKMKNPRQAQINAYMVSVVLEAVQKSHGNLDNIEVCMIELTEPEHIRKHGEDVVVQRKRYICELEVRGKHYNAVPAPGIVAVSHAKLAKTKEQKDNEYVSRVWSMGFNTHGMPYNSSAEQWERIQKRGEYKFPEKLQVTFIPLNEGMKFPADDVIVKEMRELNKGGFVGQKRIEARNDHVHGAGCNHR